MIKKTNDEFTESEIKNLDEAIDFVLSDILRAAKYMKHGRYADAKDEFDSTIYNVSKWKEDYQP